MWCFYGLHANKTTVFILKFFFPVILIISLNQVTVNELLRQSFYQLFNTIKKPQTPHTC